MPRPLLRATAHAGRCSGRPRVWRLLAPRRTSCATTETSSTLATTSSPSTPSGTNWATTSASRWLSL
eukprot:5596043-Pleurochrysis_carterae.AAC.1